jgi:F0F1-type ATP synthase membrane subunit b/b'
MLPNFSSAKLKKSKAVPIVEGATPMRTVQELRAQAKQCLELANRTNEFCAKNALKELAQELNRRARQAERRDRDRRTVVDSGLHLAWR